MTPSNYQRTRWLTLIGTIITQFALGSVYTRSLFNGALSAKLDAPVSGRFLFRLVKVWGWQFRLLLRANYRNVLALNASPWLPAFCWD